MIVLCAAQTLPHVHSFLFPRAHWPTAWHFVNDHGMHQLQSGVMALRLLHCCCCCCCCSTSCHHGLLHPQAHSPGRSQPPLNAVLNQMGGKAGLDKEGCAYWCFSLAGRPMCIVCSVVAQQMASADPIAMMSVLVLFANSLVIDRAATQLLGRPLALFSASFLMRLFPACPFPWSDSFTWRLIFTRIWSLSSLAFTSLLLRSPYIPCMSDRQLFMLPTHACQGSCFSAAKGAVDNKVKLFLVHVKAAWDMCHSTATLINQDS